MLLFSLEILILPFLMAIGLTLLIPAGLFLRAVPFLRGIGGTLIAIGLGIALFWPATLALLNAPVTQYFGDLWQPVAANPAAAYSNSQNSVCPEFGIGQWLCFGVTDIMQSISNSFSLSLDVWGVALATILNIYPFLNYFLYYSLYLVFQLFVLLVIDILLVYPLTDGVARMLGGTIRLSLTDKLRLA